MTARHKTVLILALVVVLALSACLSTQSEPTALDEVEPTAKTIEPTETAQPALERVAIDPTPTAEPQPLPTEAPQQIAVAAPTETPIPQPTILPVNGITYFVATNGEDSNSGRNRREPFETIDKAFQVVQPGDVIVLAAGDYYEDINTYRDGLPDAPITVLGPPDAELQGADEDSSIVRISHDYYHFHGFTIDGLHGDDEEPSGYSDKLVYVQGHKERQGVTGTKFLNMTFKNAGGECLRFRYFAHNNEVAYSTIRNCGIHDFRFDDGAKNGEGVYIGTASNQWDDGKNRTNDPDESNNNWIHHNYIVTRGNECVEMKEGTSGNIVENNYCTGQRDPDSAGIGSRGNANIIRYNEIYDNKGGGIRLGGHTVDNTIYGILNVVYGNILYDNEAGGIKIETIPQSKICDNDFAGNGGGNIFGSHSQAYSADNTCK